jgi:uncharacterized repeat protein (TIGR03803 family)
MSLRSVVTVLLTFCLLTFSAVASAQTKKTIHSFQGVSEGAQPDSNLISDGTGGFYGVAPAGGSGCDEGGCGVFFHLTQSAGAWSETVLYAFQGSPYDGAGPNYDLIQDTAGNIYGSSLGGGAFGYGAVFELSPPKQSGGSWTETTLYSFSDGLDGSRPEGGVTLGLNGELFGITFEGGPNDGECDFNCGVVFQLLPPAQIGDPWTEVTIYNFPYPQQPGDLHLLADSQGALFGPNTSLGTIFKLSPNSNGTWAYTDIYKFTGGSDGIGAPVGLITDKTGTLYGTSYSSTGGAIYQLVPPTSGSTWSIHVLYSFAAPSDGYNPAARLVFDSAGNLYGTTFSGGFFAQVCQYGCGTVFKLSPSSGGTWTETTLHKFIGGSDGNQPNARLAISGGVVFGTTQFGGAGGNGTVFAIRP